MEDDEESKFQTIDYLKINDRQNGTYTGSQIKIVTNMLRSSLCDFSRAYILVTGTVNFTRIPNARYGRYCFKNCAPFTACRLSINNTVVDDVDFLDVVMPMYNLLEHSENYNKTTGSMYGFVRDEPPTGNAGLWTSNEMLEKFKNHGGVTTVTDAANQNKEITEQQILVPFTYLSTFFRSLEMPLINCEIELQLTWSNKCVLGYTHDNNATLRGNPGATGEGANNVKVSFQITDTKTYIPVVTLRSIESEKLLRKLERGFSKTINWNKLSIREETIRSNHFNIMVEPTFQDPNRLFILPYEPGANRNITYRLFVPNRSIDDYNVTIDGKNIFESQITRDDERGYENLRDVMLGNGDDYTVGSLIDYNYFKNTYKIIAVDLSKQDVLDAEPRTVQQIKFRGKRGANNCNMIFIMEESKDTILNFTQGAVRVV